MGLSSLGEDKQRGTSLVYEVKGQRPAGSRAVLRVSSVSRRRDLPPPYSCMALGWVKKKRMPESGVRGEGSVLG